MLKGLHAAPLALIVLVATPIVARKSETGFLNRSLTMTRDTYRYQVYVPAEWSKKQKWPVILFLHGAGERGDDGLIQTEVGIGTAIRRHRDRFPCLIVFPQCRKDKWWTDSNMEAQALKALDEATAEFIGDAARTYLTGISMGGYGTWHLATTQPARFAALGPICGGIKPPPSIKVPGDNAPSDATGDPYATAARKVGKTPAWVFHGGADTVVPVAESRKMVEALKAEGGNVKYSEYAGVGHNSWDRAYSEPELIPWLLSQRLGAKDRGQ